MGRQRSDSQVLAAGSFLAEPALRAETESLLLSSWTASSARPIERHLHMDSHFMLITSGRYATTARDDSFDSDMLLIFNPAGTEHEDHLETGGGFFTITIIRGGALDALTPPLPPVAMKLAAPAALGAARRLLAELATWGPDSGFIVQGLTLDLMSSLSPSPRTAAVPRWLGRAREMLEDGYAEPIDLRQVAAAVEIHPFHLTRTFRRYFGATPGEYLRTRRLDRAARQLTGTRRPVVEIALETGFADQAHLTRRFSAAFGMSPARYRRRTQA